jgi:hypothetical protein
MLKNLTMVLGILILGSSLTFAEQNSGSKPSTTGSTATASAPTSSGTTRQPKKHHKRHKHNKKAPTTASQPGK